MRSAPAGRSGCHRVAVWCGMLALGLPVLLVIAQSLRFWIWLFLPLVVYGLWFPCSILALVCFALCAAERAWRHAAAALALPVLTLGSVLAPAGALVLSAQLGDRLHFAMVRSEYDAQVRLLEGPVGQRVAYFHWGTAWIFGIGVAYDESDEIRLSPERRSDMWKRRVAGTELGAVGDSTPLGDHYYLVDTE